MPLIPSPQPRPRRPLAAIALLGALALTSCGGASDRRAAVTNTPTHAASSTLGTGAVVQIASTRISPAAYAHWMAIGAATVQTPKAAGPLPKVIEYEPPEFTACIENLRASAPISTPSALLRAKCARTYKNIQARILNFLITGYWLRGEAARLHMSVSQAEVHKKFQEDRRTAYPTAAMFQRFEEASRQSVADLEFAVETQMLSARLLERFTARSRRDKSERAAVASFNTHIVDTWTPRTNCRPGYVVKDCRQYRATPGT